MLCADILDNWESEPKEINPEEPYLAHYLHLRQVLSDHEKQGLQPLLALLEKPTGGWSGEMAKQGIDVDSLVDIESDDDSVLDSY